MKPISTFVAAEHSKSRDAVVMALSFAAPADYIFVGWWDGTWRATDDETAALLLAGWEPTHWDHMEGAK